MSRLEEPNSIASERQCARRSSMMTAQLMLFQNTKGHLRQSLSMTPDCGSLALQEPQSHAKCHTQKNSIHCGAAANQDLSKCLLTDGFCILDGKFIFLFVRLRIGLSTCCTSDPHVERFIPARDRFEAASLLCRKVQLYLQLKGS